MSIAARESASMRINQQRRAAAKRLTTAWTDAEALEEKLLEQLGSLAISRDSESLEGVAPEAVFASFDSGQLPAGWSTTGDAFQMIGPELALRTDGSMPMPGTVDSAAAGRKQIGILRSPTFEITTQNIHLRMKATADATVHVVIDNYQMAPFSDLLFKGTLIRGKGTDTEGEWKWISLNRDLKKYLGHRAYLEFIDAGDESVAIDAVVFSDDSAPSDPAPLPLSGDELRLAVKQAAQDILNGRSNRWLATQIRSGHLSIGDLDPAAADLISIAEGIADQLPPPRFVVAMAQGTVEPARVYIRGSHTNLGEQVPARFLQALGGQEGTRLDLANQVASPQNPLTARVIVNRIWHHLLGRGIVASVDDFGPQGQPPSHPELLDWLAQDFIASNWSLKHTIGSIVLSQTYRQDSDAPSPAQSPQLDAGLIARVDPTNELLHRMRVRRLPSESIRDAIFAVSGQLDLTPFGPSVPTHRTPFMSGRGARPSGPLDGNGRRSIYLAVYRNFLNPFMLAFDTPSPFGPQGRRSQSNVPAQALTLMNDPMVIEQANQWARQIVSASDLDTAETIAKMIEKAHGSEATESQLATLQGFLAQQAELYGQLDQRAWADLAHALFNMKAFYFLQ